MVADNLLKLNDQIFTIILFLHSLYMNSLTHDRNANFSQTQTNDINGE